MRYLDERKIGFKVAEHAQVPIVPAAILMDLGFGGKPEVRPGAGLRLSRRGAPPLRTPWRKATSAPAPARRWASSASRGGR